MIADIILAAAGLLAVVILLTAIAHLRTVTPYGGTPRPVRDAMIAAAELRGTETVVDVGAGDGRLLIAAMRAAPGIRATGYENALGVWLAGKARILLSRLPVVLRLRDARKDDLSVADVIFLYLGPEMMRDLEAKFDRELRPGTRVISHCFAFPRRKPEQLKVVPWGRREKKVWVYRW